MNRSLVVATVLAAGLATTSIYAQTAAPAATKPAAAEAAPQPQALPTKVAVIDFERAAGATHEGQTMVKDLRAKYEKRNTEMQSRASELESLKKQLQALPANTSDDQRSSLIKSIDTKDRKLQSDAQELQQEEQGDFQEAFGKLMQKVGPVAVKYAADNGFTLLMNTGAQQNELPTLLWWAATSDISAAVVNTYNEKEPAAVPATPHAHTAPGHAAPAHTTPKK